MKRRALPMIWHEVALVPAMPMLTANVVEDAINRLHLRPYPRPRLHPALVH